MSGAELVLAFLAGVAMGVLLDRWLLPPLVECVDRSTAPAWAMSIVTMRRSTAGPASTRLPGSGPLLR